MWGPVAWGTGLVLALAVAVRALRRTLAVVTVVGESMQPTFRSGDRVLVRRARVRGLRPGLVVVIERPTRDGVWGTPPPRWPGASRQWMIKRLAALPGDPLPDLSMPLLPLPGKLAGQPAARVPAGHLVVLGDNPGGSFDSRLFGYCPQDRLLGTVLRPLRPAFLAPGHRHNETTEGGDS